MTLRSRQQQALYLIERDLTVAEPKLASMFAMFTRLAQADGQPAPEAADGRGRRLGRRVASLACAAIRARRRTFSALRRRLRPAKTPSSAHPSRPTWGDRFSLAAMLGWPGPAGSARRHQS